MTKFVHFKQIHQVAAHIHQVAALVQALSTVCNVCEFARSPVITVCSFSRKCCYSSGISE